jgi:Mn-dependent DtxR family transcriptional regulator
MLAFLFSPKEGVVTKLIRRIESSRQVLADDVVKLMYKLSGAGSKTEMLDKISNELGVSDKKIYSAIKMLTSKGFILGTNGSFTITEDGSKYALRLIRIHRLWETYITKENVTGLEHIHPEAEKIEHFLPEELVDELDEELGYPEKDPHGSEIPRK